MAKKADPKKCEKHDWINLDARGLCSFCITLAMEESEYETCTRCDFRRKAYDPSIHGDQMEDEEICKKCGAWNSFR